MALVSRTGGDQSHTGPTEKLPEIIRRTSLYFGVVLLESQRVSTVEYELYFEGTESMHM